MNIHSIPGFFEPFGSILHLGGAFFFAVRTFFLLQRARGDRLRVALLAVYAVSSVLLLSMSGVYHMLHEGGAGRAALGRLDLAAIYLLIAGTHTPVQAFFFRGVARWGVLAVMWLLAATGIMFFSISYDSLPGGLVTGVYLLLGWIAGVAGLVAWRRHGFAEVKLLIAGGVVYSVGAIMLGMGWPTVVPGVVGPHEVWHIAVLVAMGLHWAFFFKNVHRPLDGPARALAPRAA